MKKVTLAIAMAALVLFAGCKKDKETIGTTLKASIEQQQGNGSKTSLDPSNGAIKWTTGDKIVVNNGTTTGTFTLTTGAGTTTGTFTYNGEYTFDENNNIAVYPETATISGNSITVTLPAEQTYAAARNGSTPMLGTFADPNNLTFTSLCGVLGISLKAASGDIDITAVEVVSNLDEKLNGTFTCTTTDPQLTVAAGDADTKKVRLYCTTTLTTTAQNFYFAMPVGTLASGFRLNVYGDGADPIFSTNTNNDITIVLNQVNQMPEVPVTVIDPLTTPLTLEALGDGTVVVNNPQSGMQYSLNGGAKQAVTASITVFEGDKVQFYGDGTNITSYNGTTIAGGTADVKVYGNIMSLIDETGYATCNTLQDNVFMALFNGNTKLTDASGLLLPATTLALWCYAGMFVNCTSLTTAPALPAMMLAGADYYQMFAGCTSLTTAPALPATTLAESCYNSMFSDCTSLNTAPALPSTTLVEGCYSYMFYGCTSLNSITCLATEGINENESTSDWVNGVASTGTFNRASGATWPTGNNGIPSGWTVNEQ